MEPQRKMEPESTAEFARRVEAAPEPRPTGWVGWVYFAGLMMLMLGVWQGIVGFTALFSDEWFVRLGATLVVLDYSMWGLIHMGLGALILLAGVAVLAGQTWGRVVGVVLAMLSAMANLVYLPAFPFWSLAIITIDVLVIYALIVHGQEAEY